MAEQLAQGEKMLGGIETELEERTRPAFARQHAPRGLPLPEQPAPEQDNNAGKSRTFGDGRPRRLPGSAEATSEKNIARTMLVIASSGADKVCVHEERGDLQSNEAKTRMFILYGMVQILVWGVRLEFLRDAIEAHRIDLLEVAVNPEFDVTNPFREHVTRIEIRFFRPIEFDEKGEFKTVTQEELHA